MSNAAHQSSATGKLADFLFIFEIGTRMCSKLPSDLLPQE